MAITIPIVSEFRDAGLKKAEAEIQGFGKRAGNALKNLSVTQVAAAGAAIGAFGVKAVMAFQNVALEAGRFSDATGLAVEDASRWIEVSGDLGVESSAVQSAIQRMNKTIGDGNPIIRQLGIEIARTADGTVDANATFQRAITTIGGIEDPTLRAAAAQQVFGKGYAQIAELMTMSSTELAGALGEVSDTKVITDDELKQARRFRESLDGLKDAAEDLQLEIGQALIPSLSDLARGMSEVEVAGYGMGQAIADGFERVLQATGLDAVRNFGAFKRLQDESAEAIRLGGLSADEAAGYMDYYSGRVKAASASSADLTKALRTVDDAVSDLRGAISDREAFRKFDETMWYIGNTFNMSEEQADEFRLAILDVIDELDNIPDETKTRLVGLVETGEFAKVDAILDRYRAGVTIPIRPSPTNLGLPLVPRAMGGPVTGGSPYLVGERGPELFVPANSGRIVPNHAMGGDTINVTIQTSADPNEVARAIETYRRRNGALRV